ncbi:hypothetical protein GALMADRAFT_158886 [Galerina marginata CBS 339.88]|uniref:HECT domain-containing protein n=1 Tax=Galerina marginata (strain CBS 339.88) TaxID=685588 RepID=A0A067T103_GALM3|nr:hypothetical protein GALMADRAFT_158886 [Galerina marginata CBS 339.88]
MLFPMTFQFFFTIARGLSMLGAISVLLLFPISRPDHDSQTLWRQQPSSCTGCSQCVQYDASDGSPSGDCFCGCSQSLHVTEDLAQFDLPPRGACPSNSCTRFTARFKNTTKPGTTVCEGCGAAYTLHFKIDTSQLSIASATPVGVTPLANPRPVAPTPFVLTAGLPAVARPSSSLSSIYPLLQQSDNAAAATWQASKPTFGTANDRRVSKVRDHRPQGSTPFGTASGSMHPRPSRRGYPVHSTKAEKGKGRVILGESIGEGVHFTFLLLPTPIHNSGNLAGHFDEGYPNVIRIPDVQHLVQALSAYNLVVVVTISSSNPTAIWKQIDDQIQSHCSVLKLVYTGSPNMSQQMPAQVSTVFGASSASDAQAYNALLWEFMTPGPKGRTIHGRLINRAELFHHCITPDELRKLAAKLENPITPGTGMIIVAPKWRNLSGPVPQYNNDVHRCFPRHVLRGLVDFDTDSDECFESCLLNEYEATLSTTPNMTVDAAEMAYDTDDEQDQMERAMALSIQESQSIRNSSHSTPGASTSTSTSHIHVTGRTRRRESEFPLERAVRRKTSKKKSSTINIEVIELEDSPEPPLRRLPEILTVDSWTLAIWRNLTLPENFAVTSSQTTDATVPILAEYIRGLCGAAVSEVPGDVLIRPTGDLKAFLASGQQWYIGSSPGDGVKRTVITELLNHIVKPRTIFKRLTDGSGMDKYTIQLQPPMVPSLDPDRRATLKAAGFITMLYIMTFEALPDIFPPSFILAVLAGEEQLQDLDFLQAVQPYQAQILQPWPLDHSAKLDIKDNPRINELVYTYFDDILENFVIESATPALRQGYSTLLFRKVLLSTSHDFTNSKDVQAFKEGFNFSLSPGYNFIDTFGSNPKPLLIDMSARFCKDPNDVLKHIEWISSRRADLGEVEKKYQEQFEAYLVRPGRLVHPLLQENMLTEEERLVNIADKSYRARRFLMMLTGSPLLPARDAPPIKLVFKLQERPAESARVPTPQDPVEGGSGTPPSGPDVGLLPPLRIQTCFSRATLPLQPEIQQLLEEPAGGDETSFSLYLYLMLRQTSRTEEFNII